MYFLFIGYLIVFDSVYGDEDLELFYVGCVYVDDVEIRVVVRKFVERRDVACVECDVFIVFIVFDDVIIKFFVVKCIYFYVF